VSGLLVLYVYLFVFVSFIIGSILLSKQVITRFYKYVISLVQNSSQVLLSGLDMH